MRGSCVAAACAGLVVLAGCGASGGDEAGVERAASTTPAASVSGSSGSSSSGTPAADGITASIPHPACALGADRVAAISGLDYLSVAKEGPGSSGVGQCIYSSPKDGTRSLTVTYTALDSAATARTHFLQGIAANSDLGLIHLPGIGDQAWLYKRLGGPSHRNTQQQLEFRKANVIVQIATDESRKTMPAKFDTRMVALGSAVAKTVT